MNGNQTQTQAPAQAKAQATLSEFERLLMQDIKTELKYTPFAAEEEISLSVPRIRKFIAVPYYTDGPNGTKIEHLPDDRECIKFLMLCRSRKLDPWQGDAFMVPFFDRNSGKPVWSLITAHAAFLKRAEVSKDYDGMDSGVIVKDGQGQIVYREGDFTFPGDQLLGGWADVYKKNLSRPKKSRVKLETYLKSFGVWRTDPAGMICKVAEAGSLRDSFPTMVGGMFLKEELEAMREDGPIQATEKRPQFKGPHVGPGSAAIPPTAAPTPGKVVQMPGAASPKTPETAQDAPDGVKTPEKEQTQPQQPPANATAPANASSEPAATSETSETEAEPPQKTEKAPEPGAYKPATPFEPRKNETPELTEVRYLLWKCGKTEDQLLPILEEKKLRKSDQKLEHLSSKRLADIAKSWDSAFLPDLTKAQ